MQKVCAQLKAFGNASISWFTFPIMVFLFHMLLSHGFLKGKYDPCGILVLDLKTGDAWPKVLLIKLNFPTFSFLMYMDISVTCFSLTIYVCFHNLQYINLPVNRLSVIFILDFSCCFILLLTSLIQTLSCEPPKYSAITKTACITKRVHFVTTCTCSSQYGSQ